MDAVSSVTMRIVLVICSVLVVVRGVDYCSVTCQDAKHTMCIFPPGDVSSCSGYEAGLTAEEKKVILSEHNKLRRRVASGQETRGPQPPAADMMELFLDDELATIAQRWADQCDARAHDRCRSTSDGTPVGQNLGFGWMQGIKPNRNTELSSSVNSWFGEVKSISPSHIDVFHVDNSFMKIGHYTQLVWATTTSVGCGLVDNTDEQGIYNYKLVCNYKSAGNVVTWPIYKRGKACSACPAGTNCSSRYPGLCASK